MKLIIDIGNTLIKSAVFDGSNIIKIDQLKEYSEVYFENLFSVYSIKSCILASVREDNSKIEDFLMEKTKLLVLDHNTNLPFVNKYSTPVTLGRDRIAVMAAASLIFNSRNILVIDAGTSITYDFINDKNEYLGGGISPGLEMRFKALNEFTDKLPLVHFNDEQLPNLIGNSTENSILSGVIVGFTKEIEGIIYEYEMRYNNLKTIVTGGDNKYFDKLLKYKTFAAPNLVLEGLKGILDFNEEV